MNAQAKTFLYGSQHMYGNVDMANYPNVSLRFESPPTYTQETFGHRKEFRFASNFTREITYLHQMGLPTGILKRYGIMENRKDPDSPIWSPVSLRSFVTPMFYLLVAHIGTMVIFILEILYRRHFSAHVSCFQRKMKKAMSNAGTLMPFV